MKKLLISLFVLFTISLPMAVYAQDAGPVEVPGETIVVTPPMFEDDPGGFFAMLLSKIQGGEWLPVFGLALMLLVFVIRKFLSKKWDWFKTKLGGTVLAMALSLTAALGTALAAGQAITFGLVSTALGVAWAAGGGWENLKDILAARASKKAEKEEE